MAAHSIFDFSGKYILTTGDDHIFHAINNVQKAILVKPPRISGVYPAIFQCFLRLLGFVPVTDHGMRTTNRDFTTDASRAKIAFFINNANVADRRGSTGGMQARAADAMVEYRQHGDDRC